MIDIYVIGCFWHPSGDKFNWDGPNVVSKDVRGYLHIWIDACIGFFRAGFGNDIHHLLRILLAVLLWDNILTRLYWCDPDAEEDITCGTLPPG
jgi:hypothetical protein